MSNNSTADTDNSAEDATVVSDQDDSITKKMVATSEKPCVKPTPICTTIKRLFMKGTLSAGIVK